MAGSFVRTLFHDSRSSNPLKARVYPVSLFIRAFRNKSRAPV